MFPVAKALRTHTAKRQVFRGTKLDVAAASARKVFSASGAMLEKNHFVFEYVGDFLDYFLDVIVAFDGEELAVAVVV